MDSRRQYAQGRTTSPHQLCDRSSCLVEIQTTWWARLEDRVYCSWECRKTDNRRLIQLNRRATVPAQIVYERSAKLLAKYGIDEEDYLRLLKDQDGKCAICKSPEPGQGRKYFHVDHNHETEEVRGLLCAHCNLGLGQFKDDIWVMASAIAYLAGKTGESWDRR